jgi:hypothetical protein
LFLRESNQGHTKTALLFIADRPGYGETIVTSIWIKLEAHYKTQANHDKPNDKINLNLHSHTYVEWIYLSSEKSILRYFEHEITSGNISQSGIQWKWFSVSDQLNLTQIQIDESDLAGQLNLDSHQLHAPYTYLEKGKQRSSSFLEIQSLTATYIPLKHESRWWFGLRRSLGFGLKLRGRWRRECGSGEQRHDFWLELVPVG